MVGHFEGSYQIPLDVVLNNGSKSLVHGLFTEPSRLTMACPRPLPVLQSHLHHPLWFDMRLDSRGTLGSQRKIAHDGRLDIGKSGPGFHHVPTLVSNFAGQSFLGMFTSWKLPDKGSFFGRCRRCLSQYLVSAKKRARCFRKVPQPAH